MKRKRRARRPGGEALLRVFTKRLAISGLLSLGLLAPAGAEEAKPRLIDPEHFAPSLRDAVPGVAAQAPVVAPDREHPAGACEKRARDWAACLQATARLSEGIVEEAEARASDAIQRRERLNAVVKTSVANALRSAQDEWRALRERECGDLALLETGLEGTLFEIRSLCRIRRNLERAQTLKARYGDGS